jgi:hypothetical protein
MSLTVAAAKLALKGFGGWFTASWKWVVISALMAALGYLVVQYRSGQDAKDELTRVTDNAIGILTQEIAVKAMENQTMAATIARQEEQRLKNDARWEETKAEMNSIRQDYKGQMAVFEKRRKHTFEEMLTEHGEMMTRRMNKATQERIDELEDAFNN